MNLTKTQKTGHKIALIALLLSLLLSFLPTTGDAAFAQAQGERKQVLYINSYHPGYKFSDDIERGITTIFQEQGNIALRVEYLDAKRITSPEYLEQVYQLFKIKYKDAHLDLVISSDDAALNFLFKNADSLFPDVPVVFVGANFFDITRLKGYERFTGVSEEVDIAGTIEIALKLHPNVRNIVVVNDTSVTGKNIHRAFDTIIPKYPQVNFEFLEDVTMDEIRQRVGTLSQDSLVYLTLFFNDKAGSYFEYDQFTSLVAESSSVPVYGTWDYSLGYGIVGGKLTSGYTEGERGAKLALRILGGEKPSDIPVEKQVKSNYMFDYKVLQKWGIDVSSLPKDSFILDRPVSFYEENKGLIWSFVIGFILLIFIIIILAINNNQRRLAQAKLAVSNRELQAIQVSLEHRVADRTKALATSSEVSRRLSTILDRSELVTEVVDQVKNAFNYYHAHIYFFNEANDELIMAGGTGEAGAAMLAGGHKIPKGRGLVGRAAEGNQAVLVSDTLQDANWLPNPLLPDTKSEAAIPISIGEQVLGVLDVQHNVTDGLHQEDVDSLQSIANQIAVAMQNIRQYENSQKIAADMGVVANVGIATSTITEAGHLLQEVVDLSKKSFNLYHAHIYLLNEAGDTLELSAGAGEVGRQMAAEKRSIPLASEQSLVARAARTQEGVVVNDVTAAPDFLPNPLLPDTRSEMAVPMLAAGKVIGVLDVQSEIVNRFTEVDVSIQTTLASQIAVALQNARSFTQSQRQAGRETSVNLITQKIQSTTSIEAALQMAARELGHALGMKQTLVTLEPAALADKSKATVHD